MNRTMELILAYLLIPFCHWSTAVSAKDEYMFFGSGPTRRMSVETSHTINVVNERFLSLALDASVLCEREAWIRFNTSSPLLLTLSKALSPAFLRFGGTSADYVVFNNTFAEPEVPDIHKEGDRGFRCGNNTQMTLKDWIKLNKYATDVGWELLFGLNALLREGDSWNPSNAIELIQANNKLGYNPGWELGNELNSGHQLEGAQLGKDFVKLRKILDSFNHTKSSLLVGPDMSRRRFDEFLVPFLHEAKGVIDAITFHHYYFSGRDATLEDFLNVEHFDSLKSIFEKVFKAVEQAGAKQKVWLGETSAAWGGGAEGFSDRYVAGLLWLDKLGLSAVHGIDVVMRQSMYRGQYALISKNLHPLPSYWLSLIYKRLVGRKVLHVDITPSDRKLRVYAHCVQKQRHYRTSEGITIYGINLHNSTVKISVPSLSAYKIHQYLLMPVGHLTSQNITLNGQILKMNNLELPSIDPEVMPPNSPLVLPPFSYGFYVFPDVVACACSETSHGNDNRYVVKMI